MKSARFKTPALSIVPSSPPSNTVSILGAAFGSLQDGFIVADPTGSIQQINQTAKRICDQIGTEEATGAVLPPEIWHICKTALRKKDISFPQSVGIDADLILPNLGTVRIRVQNINFGQLPYLLIVLEDRQQTTRNKALSEAALYGLTERETEIWQLRLRGDAYKEISAALWISIDTVKKHIKNIHAKQRMHQDDIEYGLMA
ncbi:transcriptional regulator, LuxR family protein [Synechococcus sp. PCC 7335]|uniref:helix-turn-helix transcriptional regulator n=1 Tax=Synechococcus sp. (strain ATCC 29403 / PCC 7335) TaxID=91464 RepID=UPI00017ED5C4|nr:helix-turn-helix transcriptional regulator [Synechococcus sp. PCC 7335]EDX85970.1 transcriptional regulator, LuxR family protein [Synechococcus sp. PCC 7335]